MSKEIWKDIKDYEGLYQVSNFGRVKSLARKFVPNDRILKLNILNSGYFDVSLRKNKNKKRFLVHRLVGLAYVLNSENKPQINHIDGDKLNNRADNLEWCTCSENIKHSYKKGLATNLGENNSRSKLKKEDIIKIRKLLKEKITHKKIAKTYNVTREAITRINNRKTWKNI